jgi:outer membrane lipoprotein SlyB
MIMRRKAYLTGILGLALVFAMVLTGCAGSDPETRDTWTKATNADQVAGSWQGTGTIPIPKQDVKMGDEDDPTAPILSFPGSSMGIDMTVTYAAGAANAATSITMDLNGILGAAVDTINKNSEMKNLMAFGVIMTIMFDDEMSDAEKSAALSALGLTEADMGVLMGDDDAATAAVLAKITITKDTIWLMQGGATPGDYHVTDTGTIPKAELIGDNVQLNQDGTKLRLIVPKAMFSDAGMTIEKDVELYLNKK